MYHQGVIDDTQNNSGILIIYPGQIAQARCQVSSIETCRLLKVSYVY